MEELHARIDRCTLHIHMSCRAQRYSVPYVVRDLPCCWYIYVCICFLRVYLSTHSSPYSYESMPCEQATNENCETPTVLPTCVQSEMGERWELRAEREAVVERGGSRLATAGGSCSLRRYLFLSYPFLRSPAWAPFESTGREDAGRAVGLWWLLARSLTRACNRYPSGFQRCCSQAHSGGLHPSSIHLRLLADPVRFIGPAARAQPRYPLHRA